jgi:2-desacetyl-2-hydroxyethyl bacteriochlorophyllide A dehydrogenase
MMKAAQMSAIGKANVIDIATPEPTPDEVLIKIRSAGICGTDIHIFKGEYMSTLPLIPGHEFSGDVVAVGENVTRFKVGDRVTADPNIPCNRCEFCQRNQPNQCQNLSIIGVNRGGAFAEYVNAHEGVVFPIGDIPYDVAALIEPLACVAWGLRQVEVQPGDSALVLGAGPMGCLVAQGLRAAGASKVVITDVAPKRLELASQLGVSETVVADKGQEKRLKSIAPSGFDIVADATGIPAVLETTFDYVRARGKIWVFGVAPIGATARFSPFDVFSKDLKIIGSFAVNRTFHESIQMIQNGTAQVEPLISHRLPLDDFLDGLELAQHDPDRMKVQFTLE